jgi:hypothetical protein
LKENTCHRNAAEVEDVEIKNVIAFVIKRPKLFENYIENIDIKK